MSTRNIAASGRAAAGHTWMEIERRTGSQAVSCSWSWTDTWLSHFGDVVPHRFVVGVCDGQDVAVALVTEAAARYPPLVGARLAHIGTAGEPRGDGVYVERNRLLVSDEQRDRFAAALLDNIERDRRWDRLMVPGLHAVDAESLRRARPAFALDPRESPLAELGPAGGDPLDALASGPRRRARRSLKGLAPLETEWAQTPEHGHAIMDELIELHQLRWTAAGESGSFASARKVAFHRDLIDRLHPGRGVMLVRVRREGETVGCVYGQIEDGEVLFYQSGLRRYEDNKINVGIAVHVCAMRACAENGMRAYDFLAPAMRYKTDLSTRTDTLVWATLDRSRPRTHIDRALREIKARRAEGESGGPPLPADAPPGTTPA